MKAISINQHGAPDVLNIGETPIPEPGLTEVRVKLSFAGINHLDIWVRKGHPAYPVKLPHILGSDGSGVVDKVGAEAEGISAGDRVLVFPGINADPSCQFCSRGQDNQCDHYEILGAKLQGTYAEYVVVPDLNVVAIPDELSLEEAAAFPLAYVSAWHMLINRAKLQAGETVLVVGAGSGVGAASIQIAKLKGAKVLAVTSSRHKINKIKHLGADDVMFEEKNIDFASWAIKNTDGRGVDVAIDHVGPVTFEKTIKSLGKYGRLATCGATTGPVVNLDLRYVFSRDLSILGSRMGTQKDFQDLSKAVFKKEITPIVDKIFPLEEAASAHNYIEGKQQMGKVLLKIS